MEQESQSRAVKADVVLTDVAGTIITKLTDNRDTMYFVQCGPSLIDASKLSAGTMNFVDAIRAHHNVRTGKEIVDIIMAEMERGNMVPEQMRIACDICVNGYKTGELQGLFCDDVPIAFEKWKKNRKGIYTFSNSTEDYQRLMFVKSTHGDLSKLVDGYFDTIKVGVKSKKDSFLRVSDLLRKNPIEMLFLSDTPAELDAAGNLLKSLNTDPDTYEAPS